MLPVPIFVLLVAMRVLFVNPLLPVLCMVMSLAADAQVLSFSNTPRINQRGGYNRVLGENDAGIYLLRLRNAEGRGVVSLEHYSHNMAFQHEKTYRLGAERLVKAYLLPQHCMLFTGAADRSRGVFTLSYKKLHVTLEEVAQKNGLLTFDRYDFYKDQVLASADRSGKHWVFYADSRDGQGRQVLDIALLDSSMTPLNREQKILDVSADAFRLLDLETDPEGNVYLLASEQQRDKRKTDPESVRVVLYQYTSSGQRWSRIDLSRGEVFINGARMVYNDSLSEMVVAGFYSAQNPDGADGVFIYTARRDGMERPRIQTAFSTDFVAGIVGARQADVSNTLNNFRIRKMIPRSDGGMVLVAERYYVTQRVETTYISGISQTNTTNYYHHDEVILLSLDAVGTMEWQEVIRKRQSALLGASQFSGIGVCALQDGVVVLYNEQGNGDVIQVHFQKNGSRSQRILLRSETSLTALFTAEGAQTGYNRLVLPCLRNKQISLLKLTY